MRERYLKTLKPQRQSQQQQQQQSLPGNVRHVESLSDYKSIIAQSGDKTVPTRRGGPHQLAAANFLGQALVRRAGKLTEVADVLTSVLAVAKRVLGKEPPNTLSIASNLAVTHSEQGKHGEAEKLLEWVAEVS